MIQDEVWALPIELVGLEDPSPEPCDETGEEAMPVLFDNESHPSPAPGPDTSSNAGLRAADDDAFGAWLFNQCRNNSEAQRVFAKWQENPARRPSEETFVDVFNFSTRVDLDRWSTVSRKLHGGTESAQPLRRVHSVSLEAVGPSPWDKRKQYVAKFCLEAFLAKKRFMLPDVTSVCIPFFGCLCFCCVKSGIFLKDIPIGRAFVDDLKAINKDVHLESCFPECDLTSVSFAEDVDPYDAIASFPPFRRIAAHTLLSLVEHVGGASDAMLSSLAARGIWNVWIPNAKMSGIVNVFPQTEVSLITEDGVLDFAFGDYNDDEEGRVLSITPEVSLTPQFFEKLAKACRDCKSIHKTEVVVGTHHEFDIAEREPKTIPRLDDSLRRQYAHRPIWEFQFDDLPALTVRYVPADPHDDCRPGASIHFWRNGAPTTGDRLFFTRPDY